MEEVGLRKRVGVDCGPVMDVLVVSRMHKRMEPVLICACLGSKNYYIVNTEN